MFVSQGLAWDGRFLDDAWMMGLNVGTSSQVGQSERKSEMNDARTHAQAARAPKHTRASARR